jgi:hypothetical protein
MQPVRLVDLQPKWLRYWTNDFGDRDGHEHVPTMQEANGLRFYCPQCTEINKGFTGTHQVLLWRAECGVPEDVFPQGHRVFVGTSFKNLTVDAPVGKSRSILLLGGCQWHGHIDNGMVTGC